MLAYQPWTYTPPAPQTFPQITEPLPWQVPMDPADLQVSWRGARAVCAVASSLIPTWCAVDAR